MLGLARRLLDGFGLPFATPLGLRVRHFDRAGDRRTFRASILGGRAAGFNRLRTPMGCRSRLLVGLRIRFPDPLPQSSQRIGTGLWAESIVGAEPLNDGLNHLFLNVIRTGFPFPVIEHFGKSANNGAVAVSVLMFETEEFA